MGPPSPGDGVGVTGPARAPAERRGDSARARRRGALALIAYGLFGLAILLPAGVLAWTAVNADVAALNDARAEAAASLARADTTLLDLRRLADSTGASAASAAASADEASRMLGGLATTMRDASNALMVEVLGQRPFASVADGFSRSAADAASTSQSLAAAASGIRSTGAAIAPVGADVDALRSELATLRGSLATSNDSSPASIPAWLARLAVVGLFAWLVIPAVACVAIGAHRLRRQPSVPETLREGSPQ